MEPYVCAIAGGKGGVGRTTTAISLGTALAERTYETVVVDADLGMANVARMVGVEPEETIHDVLAGEATVDDALVELESGLAVLPGAWELEAYATADSGELAGCVDALREAYELVLVDTSAGLSNATAVPIGLADGTLLVTTPDEVARYDTLKTAQLVERVGGTVLGVVVTGVTDRRQRETVEAHLERPVVGLVPTTDAGPDTRPAAVDGPASEAYGQLADGVAQVVSDGLEPAALEPAFDDAWLETAAGPGAGESDDASTTEDDDEDDGDDGVLGLFN